jgi:hypothetical protein
MTKTLGIPHIRDREPSALKGARWVREGAGALALAYFMCARSCALYVLLKEATAPIMRCKIADLS